MRRRSERKAREMEENGGEGEGLHISSLSSMQQEIKKCDFKPYNSYTNTPDSPKNYRLDLLKIT